MATIRTGQQADGTTRYTAIVRLRKGKTLVHQEARTFAHRAAAITWAKHREVALDDSSALVQVKQGATTVAELMPWYIETFDETGPATFESTIAHCGLAGLSSAAKLWCAT
jgi:hypothetical protein